MIVYDDAERDVIQTNEAAKYSPNILQSGPTSITEGVRVHQETSAVREISPRKSYFPYPCFITRCIQLGEGSVFTGVCLFFRLFKGGGLAIFQSAM